MKTLVTTLHEDPAVDLDFYVGKLRGSMLETAASYTFLFFAVGVFQPAAGPETHPG